MVDGFLRPSFLGLVIFMIKINLTNYARQLNQCLSKSRSDLDNQYCHKVYTGQVDSSYKKNVGQSCNSNSDCLSDLCVKNPGSNKYRNAGVQCDKNCKSKNRIANPTGFGKICFFNSSLGDKLIFVFLKMTLLDAISDGNYDNVVTALTTEDPNQVDHFGHSYLYLAVELNYLEIAKIMLQAGASPNLGTVFPIFNTVYQDQPEFTKLLLSFGARVDIDAIDGTSPLHIAVFTSLIDIVNYLLGAGADPNYQDSHGNTSLHLAVYKNNFKVVQALLAKGADPKIISKRGKSPIDYATFFGTRNILCLLNGQKTTCVQTL